MWIDPTSAACGNARLDQLLGPDAWLTIADNDFFSLQQMQPKNVSPTSWELSRSARVDTREMIEKIPTFRILFKDQSDGKIVAQAFQMNEIISHWSWIEETLMPQVSQLEFKESGSEVIKETLQFIILKLSSMARAKHLPRPSSVATASSVPNTSSPASSYFPPSQFCSPSGSAESTECLSASSSSTNSPTFGSANFFSSAFPFVFEPLIACTVSSSFPKVNPPGAHY